MLAFVGRARVCLWERENGSAVPAGLRQRTAVAAADCNFLARWSVSSSSGACFGVPGATPAETTAGDQSWPEPGSLMHTRGRVTSSGSMLPFFARMH
jgi:hypothetical protein